MTIDFLGELEWSDGTPIDRCKIDTGDPGSVQIWSSSTPTPWADGLVPASAGVYINLDGAVVSWEGLTATVRNKPKPASVIVQEARDRIEARKEARRRKDDDYRPNPLWGIFG